MKPVKKTTEDAENWLITAETGGGKSYFVKALLEQLLAQNQYNGTIMDNSNMKEINVTPNYISQLQIPQDKNLNGKLNPENNINKGKNNIIAIMKDMKTKISNNNLSAIKTLLDTQTISQQSKNQLLNFSFNSL